MPSHFPGMDPFLEHPTYFPGLHDSMITYLREFLQATLPEPYYAEIGDRVWVEVSQRSIGPDVNVLRGGNQPARLPSQGGVAVAVRVQPVLVKVPHDEFREPFLQIFSGLEGERLVTTVEVLSRTNKTSGGHGRDLYLQKQREILASESHLVEIDLLRCGIHSTAVPRDRAVEKAGAFDYHVSVHCFDRFEDFLVYPIKLEQPLPEVAIPLLPGDTPLVVDLQAVFDRCYDTGPYRRRVPYTDRVPPPPLTDMQEDWVRNVLDAAQKSGPSPASGN